MIDETTPAAGPAQDDFDLVESLHAWVAFTLTTGIDGFPWHGTTAPGATAAAPPARPAAAPPEPARAAAAPSATRRPATPVPAAPAARPPAAAQLPTPSAAAAAPVDLSGVTSLPALRAALGDCTRCKLCQGRTQIVFGVGNPAADLMFVGEGPGRDEDLQGEPFVGRAGQLLTDIITKGMKLRREDVYIANIVKCRPPNNRDPEPDEVAACRPFVARQIELVAPKVIVALGRVAAHAMLGTTTPISRLRGHWHEYAGIRLMPTLHPAYLLRNPADKRLVWEDIQMVMGELGRGR